MSAVRIGALAWQVARGGSVAAWAERLDRAVAEAVRSGARLLFTAEYAPLEIALGAEPDLAAELRDAVARGP
ncbi:MAG: carbon-nitrogen hydrolase, partial [Alphaproteobacteria bacterium]|nr:carbon-nitrogen hydrolase [Alphaproteobacteria bacterium]